MPPLARLISLGILTVLIVALGITFYHVLAPFLLPLFLAWVTAILCRPLFLWCVSKTNGRERLAAGLTTAGLLLVVLLPLVLGTVFAAAQLIDLARVSLRQEDDWRQRLKDLTSRPEVIAAARLIQPYLAEVPDETVGAAASDPEAETAESGDEPVYGSRDPFAPAGDEASVEVREPTPEELQVHLQRQIEASLKATLRYVGGRTIGVVSEVPGVALGVLGKVISLLVALVMFAIGLYYFLCDGPALVEAAESLIPVRIDYQRELLRRFDQVVRAVVLSTFLSALAQGFLTAAALGVAGFDHLIVYFVLASLAAMIPLAGTWLVWVPCAAWLAWQEEAYGWAAFVAIWGAVVVGTVDNVIRTYILNSSAKLHPLLAFVSVLGGLQVMGLWGVFIAPVVAACLHALIQIFNAELKAFSHERTAGLPASATGEIAGTGGGAAVSVPAISTPVAPPKQAAVVMKTVPAGAGQGKRRKR